MVAENLAGNWLRGSRDILEHRRQVRPKLKDLTIGNGEVVQHHHMSTDAAANAHIVAASPSNVVENRCANIASAHVEVHLVQFISQRLAMRQTGAQLVGYRHRLGFQ